LRFGSIYWLFIGTGHGCNILIIWKKSYSYVYRFLYWISKRVSYRKRSLFVLLWLIIKNYMIKIVNLNDYFLFLLEYFFYETAEDCSLFWFEEELCGFSTDLLKKFANMQNVKNIYQTSLQIKLAY
jgi:hypothetical protein